MQQVNECEVRFLIMSFIALFGLWHIYIVRAQSVKSGARRFYKKTRMFLKRKAK